MLFLEFSMADHRKQKMEAWTREKPQEAQKEMGQQQLCPVPGFSPHGPGVVGEAGKPTSHVNDTQCTLPESEHIHSAARFLGGTLHYQPAASTGSGCKTPGRCAGQTPRF